MPLRLIEGLPLEVEVCADAPPVLGIEHEYRVLDGDEQVDFASIVHNLRIDGLRLDPTDPNAYRTPWGGLLTVDGREAEVAIAPVALRPGCTSELEWRLVVARRSLGAALPAGMLLDGYSTHLNIEVDDRVVVAAGRLFVKRFAPAMMLLLDRATSPGLLVRPRFGRLELGGEYCNGGQLRAAATFAAAGGLACAAAASSPEARRHLPRAVHVRVRRANIRAGWYIDRAAFGTDLYRYGRQTRLRWGAGYTCTAHEHLHEAWERSRPMLEPLLDASELALVDDVVDGSIAIPLEGEPTIDQPLGPYETNPFEGVVRSRQRPGYLVEPVSIAWDAVAFRLRGGREGIVCIPRRSLAEFLDDLDAGRLDDTIMRFLASPPSGRVLRAVDQAGSPGLFDEIATSDAIAPQEPAIGRLAGRFGGGRGGPQARRRKHRPRGRPSRLVLFAGAAALGIVAVAAAAVIVTRGGSGGPAPLAAKDVPGTYAVTRTVTVGNPNFAVGTVDHFDLILEADCGAGADKCVLKSKGFSSVDFSTASIKLVGTATEPCPSDATITLTDDFDIELHPTQFDTRTGRQIPTRLEGIQHVSSRVAPCPTAVSAPITQSLVAERKP